MQESGREQVCHVEGAAKAVSIFWNGSSFSVASRPVNRGGGCRSPASRLTAQIVPLAFMTVDGA